MAAAGHEQWDGRVGAVAVARDAPVVSPHLHLAPALVDRIDVSGMTVMRNMRGPSARISTDIVPTAGSSVSATSWTIPSPMLARDARRLALWIWPSVVWYARV